MDNEKSLLAELLQLAQEKQIPYTPTQLKKMSQEKLKEVMQDYKLKELDALNETLADIAIVKIEEYSKTFNLIKEDSQLARKLQNRKLFKRDLKSVVSYFTPFLPYVGLLEGIVVYSVELFDKFAEKSAHEQSKQERQDNKNDDSSSETKEGDQQNTSPSKPNSHTE